MKTLSKVVVGAVAGVGIALAAVTFAHGPGTGFMPYGYGYGMGMHGPGGYGPGMGMMHGFGGPYAIEGRLDTLKSELKLTGSQTKAWEAFETAVRGQTQAMIATHTAMHATGPNPDAHIALMEQRLAGMKAVQKARGDLYNVLTPDQKTIADRYWIGAPRT